MSDQRRYGVRLVRGPFLRLPAHPESHGSIDEWTEYARNVHQPTVADLFCGAGGLGLGLEAAGFRTVLGVDNDPEALETHRSLFPGLSVSWDLADPSVVEHVGRIVHDAGITLLVGGPPCQPFSRAGRSMLRDLVRSGKRQPYDERRDLWQSFLRIVALATPPAVMMENVPEMVLDRDMMALRTIVDELENLDYHVDVRLLETWRYGVPQFRTRLILIALKGNSAFAWPDESSQRVTVDNAIADLPSVEGGWRPQGGAEGWAFYDGPSTNFQRLARLGVPDRDAHRAFDQITRPVREDDALAFEQMDSDTKYSDLASELKRYREDIFDDKYKRLHPHRLSRTITAHIAKDGYWYIHPYQDRTLTVREAARLQTFPDWVRFAGPPSSAFQQIGNAVPPLLGLYLGQALQDALGRARECTSKLSTATVSRLLADWFSSRATLEMPWLGAETRWLVIMGELLLSRAGRVEVQTLWPALEKYPWPSDVLHNAGPIRHVAQSIGRAHRAEKLLESAEWFARYPSMFDSIDAMAQSPHVTQRIAELAARVVPDGDQDPIVASEGLVRVAARYTGRPLDRSNKRSDGRISIARMVGVDRAGDKAHLGLIELANSLCRPSNPLCSQCPLIGSCADGADRIWQEPPLFHTQ